ncbi:ATP-binding protein [Micromonospora sp. NPDC049559]|uniref:ATP-binding protein n=1 Tax=Micromonospora sp. NPDC049559 TaxID=3155923 RepID=UPI00341E119E
MVVPHHARAARIARQRLSRELAGLVRPTLLADAVAVLAELVGNAVRHAEPLPGGVVRVAWRLRPEPEGQWLQVRVTDGGGGSPPKPRTASLYSADGRGLTIVAALSRRWGVERDGLGQSVWAELVEPVQQVLVPAGPPTAPSGGDAGTGPDAIQRGPAVTPERMA